MQKKWDIAKNRIPLDQCNLASQEARELFDYFGEYTAGVTRKTEPDTPGECPFLNFRLINSEAIENFYEIAPTIGNILLSYSGIQPSFGRVPTEYFPTGITINFADANSHVPSHIDQGKGEEVSYITSLCGVADFTIEGHYKDFSHNMRVNPGDVHMLHNPANYEERLWHGAKTIGDEPRISLAARMPLLNI